VHSDTSVEDAPAGTAGSVVMMAAQQPRLEGKRLLIISAEAAMVLK